MRDAGILQDQVHAMLRWYGDQAQKHGPEARLAAARQAAQDAKIIEHADKRDRDKARAALRDEWGNMYAQNVRTLNLHLDRLPAPEREEIESAVMPDGRRALNDPARLIELLAKAQGGPESLSDIEALMANPRSAYWKGRDADRLQSRYRALLSGTQSSEPAATYSRPLKGIADELAEIGRVMREAPRRYFRDERMQARYRELLTLRGGG